MIAFLYKGLRYTMITLRVFVDYHKRAISIMYLKDFMIQSCKRIDTLVAKGDIISLSKCLKGDWEIQAMKGTPYVLVVCSLMYAQVCAFGYSIHRWNAR